MRVTYDWTEAEWNEAVTLATERQHRRGSVPGMVYPLVGIPLIGAVLDGVRSVRGTGKLTGAGMAVPMLLVLLAMVLGAGLLFARMQRRKRVRLQMPMPAGQWEAVLQEAGWRFQAKPDQPIETGVTLAVAASEGVLAATPLEESHTPVAAAVTAPVPEVVAAEGVISAANAVESPAIAAAEALPVSVDPSAKVTVAPVAPVKLEADEVPDGSVAEPVPATVESVPRVLAGADVTVAAKAELPLQPWKDLTGSRTGERVIVFLHRGGLHAVPIRCMTPEQASHLHRMVIRKLRPAPVQPPR